MFCNSITCFFRDKIQLFIAMFFQFLKISESISFSAIIRIFLPLFQLLKLLCNITYYIESLLANQTSPTSSCWCERKAVLQYLLATRSFLCHPVCIQPSKNILHKFEVGIHILLSMCFLVDPVPCFPFFRAIFAYEKSFSSSLVIVVSDSNLDAVVISDGVFHYSVPPCFFTKAYSKSNECTVPASAERLSRVVGKSAIIESNNVPAWRIVVNLCWIDLTETSIQFII